MKKVLLSILMVVSVFVYSQERLPGFGNNENQETTNNIDFNLNPELKSDMATVGLTVANQLLRCCSSWGGTNVYATIDYENCTVSTSGLFTIPMQVGWQGSISGAQYWIEGKLLIDANGNKSWLKIKDSGGFYSGCSTNCVN